MAQKQRGNSTVPPAKKSAPVADMAIEVVAVDELHEDPANVRKHPQRNLDTIKASLARFGQQRPILIDAKNVVRAGNGTLQAARALGWERIDCVRTGLLGTEATAYSIADNRSSLLAEWNDDALVETLKALQEEEFDLAAVGFTDAELGRLFGADREGDPVDDPKDEWRGMPECENDDLTPVRSIIVHFRSEDDVRQFADMIGQEISHAAKWVWHPELMPVAHSDNPYVDGF